jgi:cytochrome c oxidase assembly factor CtaG
MVVRRRPGLCGGHLAWLAHAPSVYEAALRGAGAHLALLVLLLVSSLLFWGLVLHGPGAARGAGVVLAFTAMLQTGLLGALLTFATAPWYPVLAARSGAWNVDPLVDQQLAGLIMWLPMSAVYLAACLALIARWLRPAVGPAVGLTLR